MIILTKSLARVDIIWGGNPKAMTITTYPIERETDIRYCVTKSRI
jgi:hypothetical protein